MIVTEIETVVLRIPVKSGSRTDAAAWGDRNLPAADTLLVRVLTDEGLEGWGEAFGFRGVQPARVAIDQVIAPLCIGRDAARIGALMLELQKKLHVFGRSGPLVYALSAIDIALWDIAGKAAQQPVHQLLGGGESVLSCYASLARYSNPFILRDRVRQALDAGFRMLKLHEIRLPDVREAREEAGSTVDLALDVNCPWSLNEARVQVRELEGLRLKWLEEPLWPPENFDGLAGLRAACPIPVAAGENVSTLIEFERLLEAGAVDFVQPSVAKMGGISEMTKVFPVAAVHNVTVMPHTFYDGPGLLAAIHVAAALSPKEALIEWRSIDLEASIYGDALSPRRGQIRVPQEPGLGLDPDPGVIQAYRSG